MLPILLWIASASSLLYVAMPRMPLYRMISIRLVTVAITSFYSLKLSATLRAGFQIENANIIGADAHSVLVDIYYPDWNGQLVHIGKLSETVNEQVGLGEGSRGGAMLYAEANEFNDSDCQESSMWTIKNTCESTHKLDSNSLNDSPGPFFTIKGRQTTSTNDEIMTIFLENLEPKVYFNILRDAISNGGTIDVPTSGVAHLKASLSPPISLGVTCYNSVRFYPPPLVIEMRECAIEGVSTGWPDIEGQSDKLRNDAMKRFEETGNISDRGKGRQYTTEKLSYDSVESNITIIDERVGRMMDRFH